MKILSIETSCDETAVSIIEAEGGPEKPTFKVLANLVHSQIKIHKKYGGVFPSLAKREHSKNLVPLLQQALKEAGLWTEKSRKLDNLLCEKIKKDLEREPELFSAIVGFLESVVAPKIDLIAVTNGPGLEPALWVGINAAKVLGEVWNIPVMPVNHMEGHIASVLLDNNEIKFPAIALLISGGHTEIIYAEEWAKYKIVGETRDDAVGEAFDKVARMLGLPYPGGPQISTYAAEDRQNPIHESRFNFPKPMMKSDNLDFSFSGLKTSVLYTIRDLGNIDHKTKTEIARAFEDAVVETLVYKTKKALEIYSPKTLVIAGGVIANQTIRTAFEKLTAAFDGLNLLVPSLQLSTDNALMIALAAYIRHTKNVFPTTDKIEIRAEGNLRLS